MTWQLTRHEQVTWRTGGDHLDTWRFAIGWVGRVSARVALTWRLQLQSSDRLVIRTRGSGQIE